MPAQVNPTSQTSALWIKVNDAELALDEAGQVLDVTIEQDLILPDAFCIRIRDITDLPGQQQQTNFPLLEKDRFAIGARIEIAMGRDERPQSVLKGEVTSLDLDAQGDGNPLLTVRGYDLAYRLHRQRRSRTFRNASDSDLAKQIARDYGFTPEADSTPEVHEHVFQDNQSDWEFLRTRANRVGFELFVDMDKRQLVFRKPKTRAQAPEQEFGKSLRRVRLRLSAPAQVEAVVVKGWDTATKREIEGRAGAPSGRIQVGGDGPRRELIKRLGGPTFVVAEQPVRTHSEAEMLAQSVFDEIAGDFVQLEGVCLGDHRFRPGQTIRFKNLGKRFDHEYYLSAVTHRVTPAEGYLTQFVVSGRRPHSLTSLLSGATSAGSRAAKSGAGHAGVVVGLVTNNKDTEQGGRVKVRFPWLSGDETHWARLASPSGGAGRGFFFLPEVGDEVLVAFEHGDVNQPYVVGCLWNGRDRPPVEAEQVVGPTGRVNQRIIRSRLGHTITLDDSDEASSITIVDSTGHNRIKLDSTTGDLSLEARGQVSIKGSAVHLEAAGDLTVKGAVVRIN